MKEQRQSSGSGGDGEEAVYRFRDRGYMDLAREMYRRYPGQHVTFAIFNNDPDSGTSSGELVAHSYSSGVALAKATEYAERHSDIFAIRYFDTVIGAPPLRSKRTI